MLTLLLCIIMKIFECSSKWKSHKGTPMICECKAGRRRKCSTNPRRRRTGAQVRSGAVPCRQRPSSPPGAPALSTAPTLERSINNNHQDVDFTHDNSDYQWFPDYNYRDSSLQHASVLSSLSSSYKGLGSLACYEELARDLDANLAEADMESFCTRDIHALLSNLPPSACHLMQDTNRRGEMYASVTSSMMEKFCFDSSFSPHSSSQGEDSTAGSINTMSICKSELLFSPVKETPTVPGHFSVDSLDCDRLEQDLILTCQANKHNYTIAFEGSITMYSEDSDCQDVSNEKQDLPGEAKYSSSSEIQDINTYSTEKLRKSFRFPRLLDSTLVKSDSGLTTWSKMKSKSGHPQLKRQPSGNNNEYSGSEHSRTTTLLKSQSAPDLRPKRPSAMVSSSGHALTLSNMESSSTDNQLNVPLNRLNISDSHNIHSSESHIFENMNSSGDSRSNNKANAKPQNFSLVKLFMKQKSMSNDGIVSSGMDHSSECWPNSSEAGDSGDSFSTDSKSKVTRYSPKIGTSAARGYQNAVCDITQSESKNNTKKWVNNTSNEYSTCTFEDSLVDGTNNTETLVKRSHDFIEEEDELSEKSEHDSDRNIYATVNKVTLARPNISNINSFEKLGSHGSPIRVRGNATTQTKKSINSSITSASISSCSESDGTQVTRMHKLFPKESFEHKTTSTQVGLDLSDKSMQTSFLSNYSSSRDRNLLKVVEPSFLEQLKKGDNPKPVYVLYPNYTLPDLGFIPKYQNADKIFLKPMKFSPTPDENTNKAKIKKQNEKGKRPFSCNDVEGLRKKGFNHIRDWDSLTFLLPLEYRQILAEMPEIMQQLKDKEDELLRQKEKPLFCVSPPVRHKTRPASCDCASLMSNNTTNVSSSSSTATQPSSGYRGSSTMLTDSSAQNSPAPVPGFNPLFVYKYDSATSSEASFMNEKQRVGIVGGGPPLPKRSISLAEQTKMAINGKVIDVAPPRPPLPKGILRKSADKTRKANPNTKRYSMFEMDDIAQENITCMNVQTDQKNFKRRSLQEPYYLLKNNSIVEMKKNNDLAAKRFSQQFLDAAEKDIDDTEFFHDEGVGTESSLESGKSNDIHTRPATPPLPKVHSKQLSEASPCVYPTVNSQAILTSTDLQQLEDFLNHSGITCNDMDDWDNVHMQKVKNQVSKFLCLKKSNDDKESLDSSCSSGHSKKSVSFAEKIDNTLTNVKGMDEVLKTPPNSPNISVATPHRHYQAKNLAEMPICEEGESSPEGYASPSGGHGLHRQSSAETAQKKNLISDVLEAVEVVIQEGTGDARIIVEILCPALYGLFSDGLRETIDTSFGPANNSVWQVIEASARQGPITKSLNELVMRINSEDALSESVLKFNAFIMGLLNVHSLDAFVSYLRTRESVLRRHYTTNALLRGGGGLLTGGAGGSLVSALTPLENMQFNLDLLWQLKDMHRSFKRMEDMMSNESTVNISSLSKNQRNILKLVHSIQSSINQSSDDQPEYTPQVSVIMRNKNHNVEIGLPDLLNNSVNTKTQSNDKVRPRSCVNPSMDNFSLTTDEGVVSNGGSSAYDQTRRWSGVQLGSKLMQAFDRLALYDDSEEYTDSLENEQKQISQRRDQVEYAHDESNSSGEWGTERVGGKFRRLQRRWEMLSGQDTSPPRNARPTSCVTSTGSGGSTPGSAGSTPGSATGRSRIPRPVTSPVRANGAQTPPSNTVSPVKRSIPVPTKKVTTPPATAGNLRAPLPPLPHPNQRNTSISNVAAKKTTLNSTRVSRAELCGNGPSAPRPSSLPYRRAPPPSLTRPRRAASTSQPRPSAPATKTPPTKMVRTLWHRLPSDSGHLAFNEGERLRLVLEVDDQWLLCCRGQQKGLVPRNAVMPVPDSVLQKF